MPKIRTETLDQHNEAIWSILMDALERLLAEKPYDQISLAEIAAAAGIARSTIYNYAKEKPALIARVAAISGQELLDQIVALADSSGSPTHRMSEVLRAILAWFSSASHRHLLLHIFFGPTPDPQAGLASAPLAQISVPVEAVLLDGIESGDFRPIDNLAFVVEFMAGVVQRAAVRVTQAPDELETVTRELLAFVFGGLGCQGGNAPQQPSK